MNWEDVTEIDFKLEHWDQDELRQLKEKEKELLSRIEYLKSVKGDNQNSNQASSVIESQDANDPSSSSCTSGEGEKEEPLSLTERVARLYAWQDATPGNQDLSTSHLATCFAFVSEENDKLRQTVQDLEFFHKTVDDAEEQRRLSQETISTLELRLEAQLKRIVSLKEQLSEARRREKQLKMLLGRKFDNSAEVMAAIDMQGTWRQVKQLVEGLVREVKVCRHEQDESLELYERMLNDILCEKNQADMAHQEASRASAASSSWAEALSKRLTRTRTFHAWRHHTSVKIRRVQLATSSRVARHHARLGCFSWWRASVESSRAQRRLTRSWSGLLALRAWRELLERKRGLRERSRRELEQRRIRKMLDVWREEVVLERHVLGLEQGRVERKVRKLLTSWKLLLIMRRAKSLVLHKLTRDLYESSEPSKVDEAPREDVQEAMRSQETEAAAASMEDLD
ncbi:hypothetical protein GUITHDRAFT_118100 [Guillardia theta CCMP2712]|uniref:Uncharacterized protein n=1 Tax=Guillardia theta (strain CCMP2712) TaxID=905079 RepID=L1IIS3_GUITC|nr:hypothetical protein GUITHDRAFT_118100 [Guillardia theta CCMP2712]EKX35715.1 hypothetical protein GUITHDRAFT_118100 [Guillardia theta CCMP2712]|eukprot:XP_005822695.1 hypothetical protein GUITHDRAFT_118100 [Guillardia theta CCMP2712]